MSPASTKSVWAHSRGPVVAAAVVFPPQTEIAGIDDSKALDEKSRRRLDQDIRSKAAAIGIGIVQVEDIDRLKIYHARLHAMQLAIANLSVVPRHVLVGATMKCGQDIRVAHRRDRAIKALLSARAMLRLRR